MLLASGFEDFLARIMFYEIIQLVAGIGVLLIGIQLMSDSLEKLANDRLRKMLNSVTDKKLKGVGIGAGVTTIIQSSSATTVMTVSLVNVGILSLTQAVPIIMGANIGTTITAQIAALQSFNFSKVLYLAAFVGAFMSLFGKKDKIKTLGAILSGFGLLFIGLWIMSSSMKGFAGNPAISDVLQAINNPFLLLFIGIGITAIIQSSSAVTSLVISMVAGGLTIGSGGNAVLFVILGTNIGTCVTAILASVGTGTNAKRTALVHLLFNVIGSLLFMTMLLIWGGFNDATFVKWFPGHPETQIAMFHTFFNVITTLILLPLSGVLVFLSTKFIKDKPNDVALKMSFIDDRLLVTPAIAVAQVIKEIGHTVKVAQDTLTFAVNAFITKDYGNLKEITSKKEEVRFYTQNITKFLVQVSSKDISYKDEKTIGSCYQAVIDIDRIVDYAYNIERYCESAKQDSLSFSENAIQQISEMYDKIKELSKSAIYAFESRRKTLIKDIEKREDEIDEQKRALIKSHIGRLEAGECNASSSSIFINLVGNLERVGDHLTSIARTILV